ncbi:MAG: hypothetical protein OEL54_05930 [Flavobacteriaceae bacterium]|nr:hypothetical protein [Flavobacteriaceae bacterium]
MIAIQSYYGHKPLLDWELKCWEVSYDSILKHTNVTDIIIFTNNKDFVPFSKNVELLPNILDKEFKKGWWQIYKQWLYKEMSEPFLHIDSDLILIKDLPELTGDIICEKIRNNNIVTRIEESVGETRPLQLLCSGIMGSSTKNNIFNDVWEKVYPFMVNFEGGIKNSYRWALEEGVISSMSKNLEVQALNDEFFYHFQGRLLKMNTSVHKFVYDLYSKL